MDASGGGAKLPQRGDRAGGLPAVPMRMRWCGRRRPASTRVVLRKGKEKPIEQYGEELLELLHSYRIELVVLAGFLTILPENVIHAYPKRILNIHPSLIPSFCGAGYYGLKVHEAALAYGVKVTGATVHYVNEIPDGGEIIAQKAVRDSSPETRPSSLQRRRHGAS